MGSAKVANKRWADKNIEKTRIYARIQVAIKSGKIIKPKVCVNCGQENKLVAHHWHGYDKLHIFDIEWLCRSCHKMAHATKSKKSEIVYNKIVDILGL